MFSFPRPLAPLFGLLILSALSSGCDTEIVLDGNFEQLPTTMTNWNQPIPGDPDGDAIRQLGLPTASGMWFPLSKHGDDQAIFVDSACPFGHGQCTSPSRFAGLQSKVLEPEQVGSPVTWVVGGELYLARHAFLEIEFTADDWQTVAKLVIHGPPVMFGDSNVWIEHGGGFTYLGTVGFQEQFAYGVRVTPDTGTFDLYGDASLSDKPVLYNPNGDRREILMRYRSHEATYSVVVLDEALIHVDVE